MTPFDKPEILRLWHCGMLGLKLPVQLGEMRCEQITAYCARCEAAIPPALLRGEAIHTFTNICHVKAVGYCVRCQLTSCFDWHLKPDSLCGYTRSGEWRRWTWRRPSLFRRLLNWFTSKNK